MQVKKKRTLHGFTPERYKTHNTPKHKSPPRSLRKVVKKTRKPLSTRRKTTPKMIRKTTRKRNYPSTIYEMRKSKDGKKLYYLNGKRIAKKCVPVKQR